jgi:hypothetical protein
MKLAALSAALLAMTVAPAVAQTTTPAPAADAAPAPAAAPAATVAADAATPKFTLDTPIETIAADPAGKAVLDADFPGMTTHPAYEQFKGMSLAAVQPMSQGAISDAAMAKAKADLAALK